MSHGVLAVRRGSKGSYLLDTSAPLPAKIHWIPCVDVVVSDPTGAGNAYSAAFAVNLATLLGEKVAGSTPGGARRREESVVTAGDESLCWRTSRAVRNPCEYLHLWWILDTDSVVTAGDESLPCFGKLHPHVPCSQRK
jgi:hypothetical protein